VHGHDVAEVQEVLGGTVRRTTHVDALDCLIVVQVCSVCETPFAPGETKRWCKGTGAGRKHPVHQRCLTPRSPGKKQAMFCSDCA
jgi:hypothetical protein